jgi:hypothetical protein
VIVNDGANQVTTMSGNLHAFVTNNSQTLAHRLYNTQTGWPTGAWDNLGVNQIVGQPVVVAWPSAQVMDLFAEGTDGACYWATIPDGGPFTQLSWGWMGGVLNGPPAVVINSTGEHVMVWGTDGTYYVNSRTSSTASWSGWSNNLTGGMRMTTDPVLAAYGTNDVAAFGLSTSNTLYYTLLSGGGYHEVGSEIYVQPAAAVGFPGATDMLTVAQPLFGSNAYYFNEFAGSRWTTTDLNTNGYGTGGAAIASCVWCSTAVYHTFVNGGGDAWYARYYQGTGSWPLSTWVDLGGGPLH